MKYTASSNIGDLVMNLTRQLKPRPDFERFSTARLTRWLDDELVEFDAIDETRSNFLFHECGELDDCYNLARELHARHQLDDARRSRIMTLLINIKDEPLLAELFLMVRQAKKLGREAVVRDRSITRTRAGHTWSV